MTYYVPSDISIDHKIALSQLGKASRSILKKKIVKSVFRWVALLGIFAFLAFKLSSIGWANIIQSLPSSPTFYLLSIAFVFLPIIAERIVFQMAAKSQSAPAFTVFIRKHVINKAVMNYAGEGYFVQQLSKLEDFDLPRAAILIKDLALARTFAANFWVLLLVLFAFIMGRSEALQQILHVSPAVVISVSSVCLGVCIGSLAFFRKLTRLEFGLAGSIATTYLIRSFFAACILIAQWNLILPGTPLAVWLLFLIVFFVAKKSPVGGDLVFIGVALTLPGLGSDSAAIAAMLLTLAVVLQVIYSLGFLLTSKLDVPKLSPLLKVGIS